MFFFLRVKIIKNSICFLLSKSLELWKPLLILTFLHIEAYKRTMIFAALVTKWCPDFLWRYNTIQTDIRKNILCKGESTRCVRSLGCHISRDRRTCQRREKPVHLDRWRGWPALLSAVITETKVVENSVLSAIMCISMKLIKWKYSEAIQNGIYYI